MHVKLILPCVTHPSTHHNSLVEGPVFTNTSLACAKVLLITKQAHASKNTRM